MTEHPFRLDGDPGDEPICADCGQHGDLYADGWDHARQDPIDAAIAAVPEPEHHLIADFKFNDGTTMKLTVPIAFDTDQFETAVGLLMQLRYAAEQRKAAMKPILETPMKPRLVGLDGRTIGSKVPDA